MRGEGSVRSSCGIFEPHSSENRKIDIRAMWTIAEWIMWMMVREERGKAFTIRGRFFKKSKSGQIYVCEEISPEGAQSAEEAEGLGNAKRITLTTPHQDEVKPGEGKDRRVENVPSRLEVCVLCVDQTQRNYVGNPLNGKDVSGKLVEQIQHLRRKKRFRVRQIRVGGGGEHHDAGENDCCHHKSLESLISDQEDAK